MSRNSPFSRVAAAAFFVALAVWTMMPVLVDPGGTVPGAHLGDNAASLWNVWWFTRAIAEGHWVYRTDRIFAPFGTQLSLHTHATTHSLLAWPLTWFMPLVAAHNLALLSGLALNGICAWLLALRLTQRMLPAVVAGALFALSAHVQLRVLGHVNLVHAWVLPLFVLAVVRLEKSGGIAEALLAAAAGAIVIYTDYYYAVYAGLFTLIWAATRILVIRVGISEPRVPALRRALVGLIAIDLALIAAIAWSGGTRLELGPIEVSVRGMRNPLTVLWILAIGWALLRFPPSTSWRILRPSPPALRLALVCLGGVVLLSAPVLLSLVGVIASGDYSAPRILWRSSPAGADALTLVLGHPLHLLTGHWTRSIYGTLDIDLMEQSLWLGLVPLVFLAASWRSWRDVPGVRVWAVVAVVFFVLSLGPFLRIGGFDTALPLPHALMRYVPGVGNARIPGRAVVMVNLAVAVLTALALSRRPSGARVGALALAALMVLEVLPAPARAEPVPEPDAIDTFLLSSSEIGAVVELPSGLRDGFGQLGALDHRALVRQLWHGRPLVGGFVARMPSGLQAAYEASPILMNLLDLSTPARTDARLMTDAARQARELGIAYLVLNRDTFMDERLPQATLESAGFRLLRQSGTRELYSSGHAP